MQRVTFLSLLALTFASLTFVHGAQEKATKDEATEQELLKLRQEWANAVVKRDAGAFDRIEHEDFVFTGPDGKIWTKAQDIDGLKSSAISAANLDNTKVRIYGTVAVLTGRITYKGMYGGKDITGQYRFTETFIRGDGKWRCIACGMSGPIP